MVVCALKYQGGCLGGVGLCGAESADPKFEGRNIELVGEAWGNTVPPYVTLAQNQTYLYILLNVSVGISSTTPSRVLSSQYGSASRLSLTLRTNQLQHLCFNQTSLFRICSRKLDRPGLGHVTGCMLRPAIRRSAAWWLACSRGFYSHLLALARRHRSATR